MKHAREDYNRFQDPKGKIPEDEPVFLLRGQDTLAPGLLRSYANMTRAIGGSEEIAIHVEEHAKAMDEWQTNHKKKVADLHDIKKPKKGKKKGNPIMRRDNMVLNTLVEIKIQEAMVAVDGLAADPRLTQALDYLYKAKTLVGRYIDEELEDILM